MDRHFRIWLVRRRMALANSFEDVIIAVEELRLPKIQLHENKHFKNCKFVGPAAIAIIGGHYVNTSFHDCDDVIALPKGSLSMTGIVVLKNCTVDECEFIRTTILADQGTAPRCCPRHAVHPEQCVFSPPHRTAYACCV